MKLFTPNSLFAAALLTPVLMNGATIIGSSINTSGQTWDLTAAGVDDWAYWNPGTNPAPGTPTNTKAGGSLINDVYVIGSGTLRGSSAQTDLRFIFSDGTSPSSGNTGTIGAIFSDDLDANGSGVGLDIVLPTTDTYEVTVYGAGYFNDGSSDGVFTASLPGATDYVNTALSGAVATPKPGIVYSLTVTPDNPNDTLSLQLTLDSGGGSTIEHVLWGGVAIKQVPEPQTYALLAGLAALGVIAWRRR